MSDQTPPPACAVEGCSCAAYDLRLCATHLSALHPSDRARLRRKQREAATARGARWRRVNASAYQRAIRAAAESVAHVPTP